MARASSTPAPAPDPELDAVVPDESPAEGVADSDTPDPEPDEAPAEGVADSDTPDPEPDEAPVAVPVEHWWIATADFTASVDWCTITAKAGSTRFDPVTGATLAAAGAAVAPAPED
jgi:hypothetical protein